MFSLLKNWVHNVLDFLADLIFPTSLIEGSLKTLTPDALNIRFPNKIETRNKNTSALFPYKNRLIKEMIWLFKYKNDARALNLFANILGERIISESEEFLPFCAMQKIVLIPIPTSKKRSNERGLNHTLLLAEKIIELYGRDFFEIAPNILTFQKDIKRQTACKNKKEREENMKNAFTVSNNKYLSGRYVAVIDDVTTTGATFKEALRVLADSGPSNSPKIIKCFAIAHWTRIKTFVIYLFLL